MEEFGFFEHIYEYLPPEFTAVFEIARILENEDSPLRQKLEPVLRLPSISTVSAKNEIDIFQHDIPSGEEFEADFIRNRRDLSRIYSWQFLLPDEIFDQRLAERRLWIPAAKAPVILPVQDAGEYFSFSSNKQKVFILFDTSNSMRAHHRIHFAKALLFYFLDRNKDDMGFVALRTFDDTVGELQTAVDDESYRALVRNILRITKLGSGTVLQRALLQALDDIASQEHLAGAEILVITDGAVSIDEQFIRSRMDQTTAIHTVKIGHAQVYASEKQVEEMVLAGKAGHEKLVADLTLQENELLTQINVVQGREKRQHLEQSLRGVRSQLKKLIADLGSEYHRTYGHELERLSSVYIEVDDLPNSIFAATPEMIADLEILITELEADAAKFFTPELTKKIAILHDHLNFLAEYEKDPALRDVLDSLDDRLRHLIEESLTGDGEKGENDVEGEAGSSRVAIPLAEDDLRDLHFLLAFDGKTGRTQWLLLFRFIRKTIATFAKRVFTATIRLKPIRRQQVD
jgi:hypothetical protein